MTDAETLVTRLRAFAKETCEIIRDNDGWARGSEKPGLIEDAADQILALQQQIAEKDARLKEWDATPAYTESIANMQSRAFSAGKQRGMAAAEATVTALRAALQRVADDPSECECQHDDEDCCRFDLECGPGWFCARCFAASVLGALAAPEEPDK